MHEHLLKNTSNSFLIFYKSSGIWAGGSHENNTSENFFIHAFDKVIIYFLT
jgi:hypothetical protein